MKTGKKEHVREMNHMSYGFQNWTMGRYSIGRVRERRYWTLSEAIAIENRPQYLDQQLHMSRKSTSVQGNNEELFFVNPHGLLLATGVASFNRPVCPLFYTIVSDRSVRTLLF